MSHSHGSSSTTTGSSGSMAMALHWGLGDSVLFESFAPSSNAGLLGAAVFVFALAIVGESIGAAKRAIVKHRIKSVQSGHLKDDANKSLISTNKKRPRSLDSAFIGHQVTKFVLEVAQTLVSFLVMLIVMQFNIVYLLAASLGYGVAAWLFESTDGERL
ncbi:hypothetical protein HDU79_008208 [Rhizoclosmatium sp. JEL0117]|nr:hypothetical protein HDU79_008208 [Rhizoclosmatium sp. JEL0117]